MDLDPLTTAFVFPGQGSQAVGMGHDLALQYPAAKDVFSEADELMGLPFSAVMWEGPEADLSDTVNTQPALYLHSMAALRTFKHHFPEFSPAALAGHSLGELSAFAASGTLTFSEGLELVRKRGELMKRAGEIAPGGMAAILGLDIPTLDKICAEASTPEETVQVANDNCPGQVVISGARAAVDQALGLAKAAGARRAIPLAVSIAAHSPLMASIQNDWDAAVDAAVFRPLDTPVIGNVIASDIRTAEMARSDLKSQMQSRVRWTESILLLVERGITTFVELGTGSVLGGLIKRIAPGVSTVALGSPQDFADLEHTA